MPIGDALPPETERVATEIVDAAYQVFRHFGPGILESAYETCLAHLLRQRGFRVERQVEVPLHFDGVVLESGFRIDLLVDDCVIVELKAVEKMIPLYDAQVLTYLKLTNKRLGILINFNVTMFKEGIKRIVR
ncbi:MAG: GxxExxY protein [Phycisphaerae bacterium]|nr:GxxExxY protein [Tepidisphaeraceae bacterium]